MTAPNLAANMVDAYARAAERALFDIQAARMNPSLFKRAWFERAEAEYDAAIRGMQTWSA